MQKTSAGTLLCVLVDTNGAGGEDDGATNEALSPSPEEPC